MAKSAALHWAEKNGTGMQRRSIANPPFDANAAAEVVAEHTPDQPPVEITLESAIRVIATQRNLLDSRDWEIRMLHTMLKAAADMMVPAGTVWQ